jgi:hypothetical protein
MGAPGGDEGEVAWDLKATASESPLGPGGNTWHIPALGLRAEIASAISLLLGAIFQCWVGETSNIQWASLPNVG